MRITTTVVGSGHRAHWTIHKGESWYLAYARPTQHGHRYDPGVGDFRTYREAQEAKRRIRAGELDPATLKPRRRS